jgi:hypothetical protein
MYSRPVIERVKEGLGAEILQILSFSGSKSSKGGDPDSLLREFLENALQDIAQQRPFRKQLLRRIGTDGTVHLPMNVISIESVWHKSSRLMKKESPQGLTSAEYYVDISSKIIRLWEKLTGTVEVNSTVIPKEEDVSGESKRTLVLHVKAQCCKYVAQILKGDPSLRFSNVDDSMNNPGTWEREAQVLRQRFSEAVRTIG